MELGIDMFGDLHISNGNIQPAGERLQQLMEEIKLMDELGLDFFGIGEHHRPDYVVSVPEIVLAAAATITQRIKLGSAVSVLSSADPVRLYQSFATIDQLSNGRAEIMAGRGSFIESFPLYGYNLEDYDDLFEEKLQLLLQINQQNPITWKGKFRAALNQQEILPRAYNDRLNIWVAVGGTPQSVVRAAKAGLPVIFAIIGGSPQQFKPLFEYYKQLYEKFGHDVTTLQAGVHVHAFFGTDSAQVANDYYPFYAAQMDRVGASRGWPPYRKEQFDFGRTKNGALIIGDANEAIDKILYLQEMFGLTPFFCTYGSVIAPAVRKALKVKG